jgi:hypothetical protein
MLRAMLDTEVDIDIDPASAMEHFRATKPMLLHEGMKDGLDQSLVLRRFPEATSQETAVSYDLAIYAAIILWQRS